MGSNTGKVDWVDERLALCMQKLNILVVSPEPFVDPRLYIYSQFYKRKQLVKIKDRVI